MTADKDSHQLYRELKRHRTLSRAWRTVYDNALRSKSKDTRDEAKEFAKSVDTEIKRISAQLSKHTFKFLAARGVPLKRPGKAPRPIVVAPMRNRIVHRALLDVLQSHKPVAPFFDIDTSFGGIEGRGVPDAIRRAYDAMANGATSFIRSDIAGFFTKIPKTTVIGALSSVITDEPFLNILKCAVTVELENLAQLGPVAQHFPLGDEGVAQGSSLSPLFGNILLHEFDRQMNGRGITCLRYVDDFILLGSTKGHVLRAFESAQKWLGQHEMEAYDPRNAGDKAEMGETQKGFSFLGCRIQPGLISPDRASRKRLLQSIDEVLARSAKHMENPHSLARNRSGFVDTLYEVSNILRGWGNQYAFCNDRQVIGQLDADIDAKIKRYHLRIGAAIRQQTGSSAAANKRRLLGVHLLSDSKSAPIIEPSKIASPAHTADRLRPKTEPILAVAPNARAHH